MGFDLMKSPPLRKVCAGKFVDSDEQAARLTGVQDLEHFRGEEHERIEDGVRADVFGERPPPTVTCVYTTLTGRLVTC